ncbi:MAG: hypothetical protein P1U86_10805 [Verrucomicrobiales bacterium]|nr:hypothetical protein [Verrucomicrobiales bacterium]
MNVPDDVCSWFKEQFAQCNQRISQKISLNPNTHEPSLDMTFVEHFSQLSAPRTLSSGWTVRIDTHFLGGLRHYLGKWEIADIGLIVHYTKGSEHLHSKAAVLQSKRLYPKNKNIKEDVVEDYMIGMARLSDPEDFRVPPHHGATFDFNDECAYGALKVSDEQWKAIKDYTEKSKVPVYYQFYNPLNIPYSASVPFSGSPDIDTSVGLGTRIVPSADIFKRLGGMTPGSSPKISDLSGLQDAAQYFGWSLEYFVAGLLIPCIEGYRYKSLADENIERLFYRRSGAIASAVAFTLEAPEDWKMED